MAWIGSDDLADAMGRAMCGCEQLHESTRSRDPRDAARLRTEGLADQEAWRCPCRDGATPGDERPLDAVRVFALGMVARLLGAAPDSLSACPQSYARAPWVHEAVAAHRWWEKGQLAARYGEAVPQSVVDAVDVIESAIMARKAADAQRLLDRTKEH